MSTARPAKQLLAKMPTKVGLLAEVTGALRAAGVNISAVSAYEREGQAKFLLVTEDNQSAKAALERLGADVSEREVMAVRMPDDVGALDEIAKVIGAGDINIEYLYATAGSGETADVVFRTSDDERAIALINGQTC